MRARIIDLKGEPILHDEPSIHHIVQFAFTDKGNWYRSDMHGLIYDIANHTAAQAIREQRYRLGPNGQRACQCFIIEKSRRAPLSTINGALC